LKARAKSKAASLPYVSHGETSKVSRYLLFFWLTFVTPNNLKIGVKCVQLRRR